MTMSKRLVVVVAALTALALVGGAACAPRYAGEGDTVAIHYTGTTSDDGVEFDSSVGGEPLEFVLGQPGLIAGFSDAVYGMKVGETKTVNIPAAEAYGPRNEDLVMQLDLDNFPGGTAEIGQSVQVTFANDNIGSAVVTAVSETTATIDANMFLAGKDLTFEIKLVSVR